MNGLILSPALGWPVGIALAVLMVILAVVEIVQFVRRRGDSDETIPACVRRVLAVLLVAGMALTPSIASSTTSRAVNATDVVVAVDVTGSMAVRDAQYGSDDRISRLDAAKRVVTDLTELYADASFAALRFGASGTLDVPLTPDSLAIRNWADTLAAEATSVSSGSSLDAPLDQLLLTLKSMRQDHPDDAIVLYLITDGEETSGKARRTFSSLRRYLDDAFAVGVGSSEGGQVPLVADGIGDKSGSGEENEWAIDPTTGQPGVSKLDQAEIDALADEMGGTALTLSASQTMANGVSAERSEQWRVTTTTKQRMRVTPVVWPLAVALAAVLAWELGAMLAQSRRLL